MRTQPCEASWPIEQYSLGSIPWMPGAAFDRHEARLQRVAGAGRDDRPRERARPRFFRHVPRRVDLLPFDVVQAGRRFEPFHADGDFIRFREFQVFVEAQFEVAAVDDDVGRILARQLRRRHRRLDDVRRHRRPCAAAAGAVSACSMRAAELVRFRPSARLRRRTCSSPLALGATRRVARRAVRPPRGPSPSARARPRASS